MPAKQARPRAGVRPMAALIVMLALPAVGCQDYPGPDPNVVTVPSSDSTPPSAVLDVSGFGPLIEVTAGGGAISRTGGASEIGLIGIATDNDGGAHEVSLAGDYTRACVDLTTGISRLEQGLFAPLTQTQAGKPGYEVTKQLIIQSTRKIADYTACPTGYRLGSLDMHWHVEAVNFFAGTDRTAVFAFHYP